MSMQNVGPIRLSILNGQTDSAALSSLLSAGQLKILFGSCVGFTVAAPGTLTGTINVQVVPTEGSSSWVTLQSAGSDITLPASKATPVDVGAFRDLRIHSSGAEGGQRDFDLTFQLSVTDVG